MTVVTTLLSVDDLKRHVIALAYWLSPNKSTVIAVGALLSWLCYRTLRRVAVKSLVRGLPGPYNPSWLTGNFPEIYDVLNVQWHREAVGKYGKVFQISGMFGDEQLYIADPRAMHHVLVKDQAIFEEPQSLLVMNRALMGDGLLATLGDHHKKQRKVLNSVFSVKHMRELLPIFSPISRKLCAVFESKLVSAADENTQSATQMEINVYEWTGRTSLELLAQGGLGTSLDSLVDGIESEHAKLVKEMVPTVSRLHVPMQLLPIVYPFFHLLPIRLRSLMLKYSPLSAGRKLVEITDRLEETSRNVLNSRSAAILAEVIHDEGEKTSVLQQPTRDILSVLLRAQHSAPETDRLPDDEVIAQITTLIFAAQDTTSSALSRSLHVLAENLESQDRLRYEVRQAKENANQTESPFGNYDDLMRLPFLDAVVRELLRLYPPVSWIWRVARAPTTLPLYRPISLNDKSQLLTSVPLAKNQGVIIGIAASQRDESIWGPDASVWRPERWLSSTADGAVSGHNVDDGDEWKTDLRPVSAHADNEARYPGVYSGMMTFSAGGRSCIGFKFALLALKLQLAALIDRFQFAPPEEEIIWNMNHIAAPTVRGREQEGAQLPLKVSFAA